MANIHDVNESLQVQPSVRNLPTLIALSQGENGRSLQFRMVGATIPSGSSASLSGTKPDGVVYSKVGTVDGNTVIFQEDVQLTAVAGAWDAKIHIVNSGNSVATALIRFIIDPDPVAAGAVPSDSQLEGIVAECKLYAENVRSAAYGSPLTASAAADMIDTSKVYVYTGSETGYTAGNWYYWNGSAWTSGGIYNSAAIQTDTTLTLPDHAADSKTVGDGFTGLKKIEPHWTSGYLHTGGTIVKDTTYQSMTTEAIPVNNGTSIHWEIVNTAAHSQWVAYCLYDKDGVFISPRVVAKQGSMATASGDISIQTDASYIKITFRIFEDSYPLIAVSSDGLIHGNQQDLSDARNNIIDNEYRKCCDPVYLKTNGESSATDTRKEYATDYIAVEEGDVYFHYAITADSPWMAIAFYDSTYTFIADSRDTTLAGTKVVGSQQYAYQIITIPSGVAFFRACTRTDDLGQFCLLKRGANWITDEYINDKIAFFEDTGKEDYPIAKTGNVTGINHRGFNTVAPENTFPAFKLSRKKGFACVETDVRFTSDGVPVLLHDKTINRTGRNADGTAIAETINLCDITYEETLEYDFGIWKSSAYAGTEIPAFEDFMKLCRDLGLDVLLEIKSDPTTTAVNVAKAVDIVKACGMWERTEWSSGSTVLMDLVLQCDPSAPVILIASSITDEVIADAATMKTNENWVGIDADYTTLTTTSVQKCIDAGMRLYVYTPNTAAAVTALNPYVSGVASDSINAPVVLYQANIE